jgi:hypothetical protein
VMILLLQGVVCYAQSHLLFSAWYQERIRETIIRICYSYICTKNGNQGNFIDKILIKPIILFIIEIW